MVYPCDISDALCVVHARLCRCKDSGITRYGLGVSYLNFTPNREDIFTPHLAQQLPVRNLDKGLFSIVVRTEVLSQFDTSEYFEDSTFT